MWPPETLVFFIFASIVLTLFPLVFPPCCNFPQLFGVDKVKRGAYLASLAQGPSVAQDLGLKPKDRLISVDGEDVKALAFDRIG